MYRNYLEVKKNIDSLKWGREEKVTDAISRRRLINDGADGYSYKYYTNSKPNEYIVMSSGKKGYAASTNINADAVAFGVRDGVTTKTVNYLDDNYIHQNNYFRDPLFDKLGNVAVKDFKLKSKRRMDKVKNEPLGRYNKTLKKEFIEKLKPELEKAAKNKGVTISDFRIDRGPSGAIFPSIHFYLNNYPITMDTNLYTSGKSKYFGYMNVGEPRDNRQLQQYKRIDKIVQELTKIVNDTVKERTSNLMKDPDGRNLRINAKAKAEKEGMSALKGSTIRLQYEEYEPNYFPY